MLAGRHLVGEVMRERPESAATGTAVRRWHRPLVAFAGVMAALAVVSGIGVLADDRVLGGAPIWLKPLKFSVSFTVYSLTLAWMLSLLQRGRRWGSRLGTLIVATSVIEMVVIVGQVVRGRHSHFNAATALDATLFSIMGATIAVLWIANLGVALLLVREPLADRSLARGVRLGLLVAVFGMALGFLMVRPTPAQLDAMRAGAQPSLVGAHSVGVEDGGPGIPLTMWSREGGDLRVGHFVGMHGLQAVPLLALGLAAGAARVPVLAAERTRTRLVTIGAAAWAGLATLATVQALRGQPLLRPDAVTLTALPGLVAASALAAVVTLRRPPL